MDDVFSRIWQDLVGRSSGPMHFRFILQPLMATIFAIRDGVKDAHKGKCPYFWSLFTEPAHRHERLQELWKSVGRIFVIGLMMDVIYQWIVFHWIYPLEAIITAAVLALVPYVLLRGPINRIARLRAGSRSVPRPF